MRQKYYSPGDPTPLEQVYYGIWAWMLDHWELDHEEHLFTDRPHLFGPHESDQPLPPPHYWGGTFWMHEGRGWVLEDSWQNW